VTGQRDPEPAHSRPPRCPCGARTQWNSTCQPTSSPPLCQERYQAPDIICFTYSSQARRQGPSPHPDLQKEQVQPRELKSPPKVTQKGPSCDPRLTRRHPGSLPLCIGCPGCSGGSWLPWVSRFHTLWGRTHLKLRAWPAWACGKRSHFSPTGSQPPPSRPSRREAAPGPEAQLLCGGPVSPAASGGLAAGAHPNSGGHREATRCLQGSQGPKESPESRKR